MPYHLESARAQSSIMSSGLGLVLHLSLVHDTVTNPKLVLAARQAPTPAPSGRARAFIASGFCRLLLAGLWLACAALWHMQSHMKPQLYLPEQPVQFLVEKLVHQRCADRDSPFVGCQHV
eukprot:350916-Chlamydomonas_euryale.AAC.1